MSLAKVHLVDSDVPLKEGGDLLPACQRKEANPRLVRRAVFAMVWDGDTMGNWDIALGACCHACLKTDIGECYRRYLYGIIPGEESLHTDSAA